MTPKVVAVSVAGPFKLDVVFADGARRLFDVSRYLRYPAFATLKNAGYFALARVEFGTVCWPDGTDLSRDMLYFEGVPPT